MRSHKAVANDLLSMRDFHGLIEVYEELAALKMQAIRQAIITSREYFAGLARLSDEIGTDIGQMYESTKKGEAVVFVAANANLFGQIIGSIFEEFMNYVDAKKSAHIFVAGSVGVELVKSYAPSTVYKQLNIPDEQIDGSILSSLVKELSPYSKVKIFYGEFNNIVRQVVNSRVLSGQALERQIDAISNVSSESQLAYLYEPTIDTISAKLGTEVFASVFEETIRESQLAKYASRLMHLDSALTKVDKLSADLSNERLRVHRRIQDKKQRSRLLGLWGRLQRDR